MKPVKTRRAKKYEPMTKEMLKKYRTAWIEVNKITQREVLAMTPEQRWHQMVFAMTLANMPEMFARRDDGSEVRKSWLLLRKRLIHRTNK
jgi:hypothetical protein